MRIMLPCLASPLLLALALNASGASPEPGNATSIPVSINPISMTGLKAYAGKRFSAFYVSAREGMSARSVTVRSIKFGPVTVSVTPSGEAQIPGVTIQRRGFEAVNYIVFMVHDQQTTYVRNPDGSYPRDARDESGEGTPPEEESPYLASKFIGLLRLAEIRGTQGVQEGSNEGPVRLDFQSLP
jgi:hypothetical protein